MREVPLIARLRARAFLAALLCLAWAGTTLGQAAPPEPGQAGAESRPGADAGPASESNIQASADLIDRPISAVRLEGLKRVTKQEVDNNIRTAVGEPFSIDTIKADVSRLNRLGQFKYIDAIGELQADGSVAVIFRFTEQQIITEVQVVGNKLISDADLLAVVRQVPRGPRDDFQIQSAKKRIEDLYQKRGHYLTTVSIDEVELNNSGLLIFKVIEGPRVRVKAIAFDGNHAFTDGQLKAEIKTTTSFFLFRKGELDEVLLTEDVGSLDRYYKDHGYLDVRVDRTIELSPDNTEAKVTFIIAEGIPYTLRAVQTATFNGKSLTVFAPEQIAAILELKTGDIYSADKLRKSYNAVQDAYGLMGYLDVRIRQVPYRVPEAGQIDMLMEIDEGEQYSVGIVQINGNFLTRDKVIRRDIRLYPGRLFDGTEVEKSKDRLEATRLFTDVRITVQKPDPADPTSRDVLVEIKEKNTGSVNFGIAVGSDSGVFGELSLNQNNFDITDLPESVSEMIAGRAFRGAGQKFNATLRPGTDLFQFQMSLTEPHLLDSEYSGTASFQVFNRTYDKYTQDTLGGSFRLGRALGDLWQAAATARIEEIKLVDINIYSPAEYFEDAGPNLLTSVGIGLTRTTFTSIKRPGKGSRLELSFDQYGALGGDFDFSRFYSDYTTYFTLNEDFLGRLTTLKVVAKAGYIFGGTAPVYEEYYLGGRSFRGFKFRTISPKGVSALTGQPSDDPLGGTWEFFLGSQYEVPLLGDAVTGVLFVDSGTVVDTPSFDDYRVSVGFGLRLYIPQFGDVPIALDFGIPLLSQDSDQTQLFSFSADFPF